MDKTLEIIEVLKIFRDENIMVLDYDEDDMNRILEEAIKAIAERDDNWQLYLQETKKHEEYFNKYKELLSRVTVEGIVPLIQEKHKPSDNDGVWRMSYEDVANNIVKMIRGEK